MGQNKKANLKKKRMGIVVARSSDYCFVCLKKFKNGQKCIYVGGKSYKICDAEDGGLAARIAPRPVSSLSAFMDIRLICFKCVTEVYKCSLVERVIDKEK